MQIVVFGTRSRYTGSHSDFSNITKTLEKVARHTDTRHLVTALYLLPGQNQNRGTAYVRHWYSRKNFTTQRGKWNFTAKWPDPDDLPDRFKLIRMRLDSHPSLYPKIELDTYGWRFTYETFHDHLATLFAHELHHYRRYHLGLHPGEGEQSANRWALEQVQKAGFRVMAEKQPARQKKRRINWKKKFPFLDPYLNYRHLKPGDQLIIAHDPRKQYGGQTVEVIRPIRTNSKRMVVRTRDGKTWRWPMNWLLLKNKS